MAGRQFSFFLGPADQQALEDAIRSSGDIVFLADRSHSTNGQELISSIIDDPEKQPFGCLIARRADLAEIRFKPTGYRDDDFACNVTYEPVVEFDRFFLFKNFLRAGRFYRVDEYWNEENELTSKPPEFIEWADRLYKLVKKSLTRVEQGHFAGIEALAMRKSGIPFEGLDIEFSSLEDQIFLSSQYLS